jgi:hypothetical protein
LEREMGRGRECAIARRRTARVEACVVAKALKPRFQQLPAAYRRRYGGRLCGRFPQRLFSVAYFMRCKPTKQKNQRVIEPSSKARRRVIVYCCIQIFSRVKTVRNLTIKTTSAAHFVFNLLAPSCLPNEDTNDDQREQNEYVGHSPCGGLFVPLFMSFFPLTKSSTADRNVFA